MHLLYLFFQYRQGGQPHYMELKRLQRTALATITAICLPLHHLCSPTHLPFLPFYNFPVCAPYYSVLPFFIRPEKWLRYGAIRKREIRYAKHRLRTDKLYLYLHPAGTFVSLRPKNPRPVLSGLLAIGIPDTRIGQKRIN